MELKLSYIKLNRTYNNSYGTKTEVYGLTVTYIVPKVNYMGLKQSYMELNMT